MFLLITSTCFTETELEVAWKVKSIGKTFFLIRTMIDIEMCYEPGKKSFDENEIFGHIRERMYEGVEHMISSEKDIFLISNFHTKKWDFDRLKAAINKALTAREKECFMLSLPALTNVSHKCLMKKVEILRGRHNFHT